jgi:hypothetical protein
MRSTAEGQRNAALLEVYFPGTLWAALHDVRFVRAPHRSHPVRPPNGLDVAGN